MLPQEWAPVAYILLKEHQKAMLGDAETAHVEAEISRDRMSRFATVRRQFGAALVRAGERLQGVQRPEVASPLQSAR